MGKARLRFTWLSRGSPGIRMQAAMAVLGTPPTPFLGLCQGCLPRATCSPHSLISALPVLEPHTSCLPAFPGKVLASFSALFTGLEACTQKGARNKPCECGLGLQSPSPTTTMEGKGAKGMLGTSIQRDQASKRLQRDQAAARGGGHEHRPSLLGPAVSCWP